MKLSTAALLGLASIAPLAHGGTLARYEFHTDNTLGKKPTYYEAENATFSNLSDGYWNYTEKYNGSETEMAGDTPSGNPHGTFDGNDLSSTKQLFLTVTPDDGWTLDLTGFSFWGGDKAFSGSSIRLDCRIGGGAWVQVGATRALSSFASPGDQDPTQVVWPISTLSQVAEPVTFRLTAYGGGSGGRLILLIDDIVVEGSVASEINPATVIVIR